MSSCEETQALEHPHNQPTLVYICRAGKFTSPHVHACARKGIPRAYPHNAPHSVEKPADSCHVKSNRLVGDGATTASTALPLVQSFRFCMSPWWRPSLTRSAGGEGEGV